MGYKYGVWMTYEHSLLQTSHIKHVTIACLMTKENALKLYDEIVNKYGDNYKCDFSHIPHTSINYGISPNLLKPYSINNVKIQCKVHCADIRSDFPEDWKLIDSNTYQYR